MQIILQERIENLGKIGDIVTVKNGYARNFLIPFGKALKANEENIKRFEEKKSKLEKQEALRVSSAQTLALQINDEVIEIKTTAGESGKLFGSITTKDIEKIILEKYDIEVNKKGIYFQDGISNIRQTGSYGVLVTLYADIQAGLTLNVISN